MQTCSTSPSPCLLLQSRCGQTGWPKLQTIPQVLSGDADFAIGSRNVSEGGIGFEWSWVRSVISKGATLLAAPLTASSDPMSGFFCVHRATLNKGRRACNPLGFKIALEIMVRCRCRRIVDVPIMFRDRVSGESKLTMRQNVEYLRQLFALYWYLYGGQFSSSCGSQLQLAVIPQDTLWPPSWLVVLSSFSRSTTPLAEFPSGEGPMNNTLFGAGERGIVVQFGHRFATMRVRCFVALRIARRLIVYRSISVFASWPCRSS